MEAEEKNYKGVNQPRQGGIPSGQPPQNYRAPENGGDEDIEDVPLFKRKKVIIPILVVLTIVAVAGLYLYMNMQDYVSTDDAYVDANNVAISSKMLGRITYLGTDEGDTVQAGQVLVRLDESDLRAQEVSAKAGLELAQQSLPLDQVSINRAQDDFDRAEVQYKSGIVTKEQYDHAQKALEATRAQYNIDLTKITTAKAQIGVIQSQLANTVIAAPMDGVVAKRWVLSGDVIQPGQPIFTMYDLKNIWVTANLEETKLGHIHLNDPVEIDVDTYPGVKFYGKVFEIGTYTASEFSLIPPNNASGNFTKVTQRVPIKISIEDAPAQDGSKPILRPGMSVEVSVKIK
ncbi:MAG TPA: HlyD family secretion protein [Candidatus Acidoferrales bacterium]|nr:HlyD family secretion protein [Candidatus Acidoferrales bacterium]